MPTVGLLNLLRIRFSHFIRRDLRKSYNMNPGDAT